MERGGAWFRPRAGAVTGRSRPAAVAAGTTGCQAAPTRGRTARSTPSWPASRRRRPRRARGRCELGCGGGQAALRLARAGYAVTGIDFSETAIELARRNAADAGLAATFLVGDS